MTFQASLAEHCGQARAAFSPLVHAQCVLEMPPADISEYMGGGQCDRSKYSQRSRSMASSRVANTVTQWHFDRIHVIHVLILLQFCFRLALKFSVRSSPLTENHSDC